MIPGDYFEPKEISLKLHRYDLNKNCFVLVSDINAPHQDLIVVSLIMNIKAKF